MANQDYLPYGRQSVDEEDIRAVVEVLRSDWLTTGPAVPAFEKAVAAFTGAPHAVAVSNGTAGLHAAMFAAGIGPGDEVIVPPLTFAATSNAVLYVGGTPVFADVNPATLLLDPAAVERKITKRTKAIAAVDYAGQPCDYDALRAIAKKHGLLLIADACHSIGGSYKGKPTGTLADLSVFSFHPVKHITTAEGGMITCSDPALDRRLRIFRGHGITTEQRERSEKGQTHYEMVELGFNYRLSDLQCALGLSQLKKLPAWVRRRNEIARLYDKAFESSKILSPLTTQPNVVNAYHLYVVRLNLEKIGRDRNSIITEMRANKIGVNVHYPPVHLHPYYRKRFGYEPGAFPITEKAANEILSIPMYPTITDTQVQRVVEAFHAL